MKLTGNYFRKSCFMKNFSVVLLLFAVGVSCLAQQLQPVKDKAFFLDKSKSQRTAAWVLTGVGAGMTAGGAIGFSQNFELFGPGGDTEAAIMVVGIGVLGAGVIMHILATNSKQKADLVLTSVPAFYPSKNGLHSGKIPSLQWRISLVRN